MKKSEIPRNKDFKRMKRKYQKEQELPIGLIKIQIEALKFWEKYQDQKDKISLVKDIISLVLSEASDFYMLIRDMERKEQAKEIFKEIENKGNAGGFISLSPSEYQEIKRKFLKK